jgi:hypothetical protein
MFDIKMKIERQMLKKTETTTQRLLYLRIARQRRNYSGTTRMCCAEYSRTAKGRVYVIGDVYLDFLEF